jgi:hypothetical protein
MHHWLDNTSIHSVGRCLEGRGQGAIDVSALLQLATQIVFVEALRFGSYESKPSQERSDHIRTQLIESGLHKKSIVSYGMDRDVVALACSNAVHRFEADLEWVAPTADPDRAALMFAQPEGIIHAEVIGRVHGLITQPIDPVKIDEILNKSYLQERKSTGSDEFMLVSSIPFLQTIQRIARERTWTMEHTHELTVYLRYYLNQEFAASHSSVYAPSIARARVVRARTNTLLEQLEKEIGKVAQEYEPTLLNLPSLADVLVRKGRADPKGILIEAIEAREKARPIRRDLAPFVSHELSTDSEAWHKGRQILREHAAALRQDMGLDAATRLFDAFEINVIGLTPRIRVGKVLEWLEARRARRRISVLGEFAKVMADTRVDPARYVKLYQRCCAL